MPYGLTRPIIETLLQKVSLAGGSLQMKEVKGKSASVTNTFVLKSNLLGSLVRSSEEGATGRS